MTRRFAAVVALAVLAIAGCGGGSAPGGRVPARYLPADAAVIMAVDVVQARKELGLPADADALDFVRFRKPATPQGRLLTATEPAFEPLRQAAIRLEPGIPALRAFDGTKLQAAASGQARGGRLVDAVRTGQDFEQIAGRLVKTGWKRDGRTVTDPKGTAIARVTDAGDGVVLLTSGPVDVKALLDDPPGGPPFLGDVLDGASASVRLAAAVGNGSCVTAFGGWQTAGPGRGVLRVLVRGRPEGDRVDTRGLLSAGAPRVGDDKVDVTFPVLGSDRIPTLNRVLSEGGGTRLYRCP